MKGCPCGNCRGGERGGASSICTPTGGTPFTFTLALVMLVLDFMDKELLMDPDAVWILRWEVGPLESRSACTELVTLFLKLLGFF